VKEFLGEKVFVVAEMSANHRQDFGMAVDIIHAAYESGADAVKVQMFKPDSLTLNSDLPIFKFTTGPWSGMKLYELYEKACMPYNWVPKLKNLADEIGIKFFTTVYDTEAVEIAEALEIEAYKIASFEATEYDLIERVAQTMKPLFISAGSAGFTKLAKTKEVVYEYHDKVAFLKCTSAYPATLGSLNLRTLLDMRRNLSPFVGLSDHTTGIVAPVVAVAMGARVIEKHLTISDDTLDAGFSVTPDRFKTMVETIRAAEEAMGRVFYGGKSVLDRMEINGKSVRIVKDETNNTIV